MADPVHRGDTRSAWICVSGPTADRPKSLGPQRPGPHSLRGGDQKRSPKRRKKWPLSRAPSVAHSARTAPSLMPAPKLVPLPGRRKYSVGFPLTCLDEPAAHSMNACWPHPLEEKNAQYDLLPQNVIL